MTKSTLVEILGTFDTSEQKRLIDFLQSPWCTAAWQSSEPVALVSYIFDNLNRRQPANLHRDTIYGHIFSGKPFVFNKLEKLFSGTLKEVRRFIQYEVFTERCLPAEEYLLQADFLRDKGVYNECDLIYKKLEKWQQNRQKWSTREYTLNWQIEHGKHYYQSLVYQKRGDQNMRSTLDALEALYLSERSHYTFMLLNINYITPTLSPTDISELITASGYPPQSNFFSTDLGSFLKDALVVLSKNDLPAKEFNNFCIRLNEYHPHLSDYLYSHFESFAINYCVRHSADPEYRDVLFRLLKQRVEEGRNHVDGKISASEFQNIVRVGLMQKEFDWVWQFMHDNRDNIYGSQHPEAYFQFNLANYWFYTGNFDQALTVLLTAHYEELQYKYSAILLEIKIHYEMQSDVLPSKIDAAKILFFRAKQITQGRKKMYSRFADFMRKITRPKTAVNRKRILSLIRELDDDPQIAELYWLKEKLGQMLMKSR